MEHSSTVQVEGKGGTFAVDVRRYESCVDGTCVERRSTVAADEGEPGGPSNARSRFLLNLEVQLDLPVIGAAYGWRGGRPLLAGLGAALAWGVLFLALPAAPLGRLLTRLGALAHLPGPALVALTLLFAGLLGWSAARLVAPEPRPSR